MYEIILLVILRSIAGSDVQNDNVWYKGCYQPMIKNATKFIVASQWDGPGQCTEICGNARHMYAAVQGNILCYCLQTLAWYRRVDSFNCSLPCSHATHLRCGGERFFTIFDSRVQAIANLSVTSANHVNVANLSRFTCFASLTLPLKSKVDVNHRTNGSFAKGRLRNVRPNYVLVTWSINADIVKLSNRSAATNNFNDTLHHKFVSTGIHSLCCNVSNKHSWLNKCTSVSGLETINTFQLVNIHGGKHTGNGLYSIAEHRKFYIDIIVNAGSFARLLFDFGDGVSLAEVTPDYSQVKKNCSCLILKRKYHEYRKRGIFSLNITALNEISSRRLVFPSRVVVDGIITGAEIRTRFAVAGKRQKVIAEAFGSFTYANYEWELNNGEMRTTIDPFTEIIFSTSQPQYQIKVTVFNNVSKVETSRVIYIEPEVKDVTLTLSSNVSSVNSNVILKATPIVGSASFATSIRYRWELGNGEKLPGTLANLIYKYKTTGRFEARVRAENYVSQVYSKNVTVHIYEIITKVDITYNSFLFGEVTRLHAALKDGSDVTYIWDFGDGTTLVTPNNTVLHNYTKLGNYSVRVTAKNPISSKEDTAKLFVISYYCQKPVVSISKESFLEYIPVSSKLVIDVDVRVNCSVSNKMSYRWKIFSLIDGNRIEKNPLDVGVSPLVFMERSLVLPPYSLAPGKYVIESVARMEGTIVHNHLSNMLNVLPSKIKAIISGGTTVLTTRKSHKNITLDASQSYDPDDKSFKNLRYKWTCKSVLNDGFGDCFRPNTTMGVNWTLPTLQFLPRIFVKSSSLFAFLVTVSRDGLKRSSAVQFVEVEDKTVRRLQIDCERCTGADVNSHKDIKVIGRCSDCGNTPIRYQWKVHFKPKAKVFLHHFGNCVPADGTSWKRGDNLNETNTTSSSMPSTLVLRSTISTKATILPTEVQADVQRVICEYELKNLRNNWTDLDAKSRTKRDVFGASADSVGMESKFGKSNNIWDDMNDEKDETFDDYAEAFVDAPKQMQRSKRNVNNATLSGDSGNSGSNNRGTSGTGRISSGSSGTFDRQSGQLPSSDSNDGQRDDDTGVASGVSESSGFSSTSGSGRGPNGGGSGSGRQPPNSQGTGRGCEGSFGIAGGIGAVSGGSGATGGCSGNQGGFGEGAKAHKNKTDTANGNGTVITDGSTSGNLVAEDKNLLNDNLEMIREIVDQPVLSTNIHWGLDADDFVIKKNTLIPGQLYKVEFVAYWQNDGGGERIAGRASEYFLTNTGPYLGSCEISPRNGTELKTLFFLDCKHWKDKHNPLTFSVQYRSPSTRLPVIIYSGLYTTLNFTLPAGNSSSNNTIDIEITVQDTEDVKTELCPIKIQVLPLANDSLTVEKEIYYQTIGSKSILKKYEDTSDKVAAMVFISNAANTLNRLQSAPAFSSSKDIREKIRARLLQSVNTFNILSKVFALQLSGIAREITKKATEMSLKSVNWSNEICVKILHFYKSHEVNPSRDFSLQIGKHLFAVVASGISSISQQNITQSNGRSIRTLVKQSIRIHDEIIKILQNMMSRQLLFSSESLATLLTAYGGEGTNKTLSLNGCIFTLPNNLGALIQNSSNGSARFYSTLSIYQHNPFRWGRNNSKIDTIVASLDFQTASGTVIKLSNLTQPLTIKLPVRKRLENNVKRFSVQVAKMNIHHLNATNIGRSLFIRIEEENSDEMNEHYALQAVVRYNKEPTQKLYNNSLQFIKNKASIFLSTAIGSSDLYVGLFLKALGKVAKKNQKPVARNYKLSMFVADCKFWDQSAEIWSTAGCEAAPDSTTSEIICSCNHLTSFGGSLDVLEGMLTVKTMIEIKRSDEHHHVLAIILTIVCFYLLLMVVYGTVHNSKGVYTNIAKLPDNHPADLFKYLVIVETGSSFNAGTTGRVSIIVYGEEGHSQIRELTCYNADQFKRGSTNCVIMSFPDSLGDIKKIRLWHDNGGNSPDWFLKQITIVDCQSDKQWYFHWNDWLAISENHTADCEILTNMEPLYYNLQTIFEGFLDYHAWISIFTRPAGSKYTPFQRLVTSFTVLISYMVVAAVFLHMHKGQLDEVLGIWDIKWIGVITSITCSLSMMPLQLIIEALFRNTMGKCDGKIKSEESKKPEMKILPDEDITKPSGAVFFMEFNSTHSSQNILYKDDDESFPAAKGRKNDKSITKPFLLPSWVNKMLITFCLLLSASGISVTLLYSMGFQHKMVLIWIQILLLSFLNSMFIFEFIKALMLSVRRIYKLCRNATINEYMGLFYLLEENARCSKQEELTEKQIMAARARARFVRFSKPILGDELKKARKKAEPWKYLLSVAWHASTCCVFLLTLLVILRNFATNQDYHRNNAVKHLVTSGNTSFNNISKVEQFWHWSKTSLVDLLKWDNWHHLRNSSVLNERFDNRIYTFGPACLEKEDSMHNQGNNFSSRSSNSTMFSNRMLIVGQRSTMVNTLHELQSHQWIYNTTRLVKVSFVYFHPETNLFSGINMLMKVSPPGSVNTVIEVDSITLYPKYDASKTFLVLMTVICIIFIILCLRNEFCQIMDKGIGHLKCGWAVIEGMIILFTLVAVISHICLSIALQKALYQVDSMELNDPIRFLNLQHVIHFTKVVLFVHATLLLLVVLRCIKLLRAWRRFSILFSMFDKTSAVIPSLIIIATIIIFALSHMGVLIYSLDFNRVDVAWRTLWPNVNRSIITPKKEVVTETWFSSLYKLLAGLVLFAFWRVSVVLYLGGFKAAQSTQKRKGHLLKTFKRGLQKFRSKKVWIQLFSHFWNKLFKKQEDRYKVCNLPFENVYEEIEYQVEEVLFRLNNLFDMDGRHEKTSEDEDDLTLDSSEEAAYPSSYSTKDSISLTSESLYSEDSGYYRYGEYRGRCPSITNSDGEYEGPIIHRLEPQRQLFSDLGQKLTPIFGGRYFVKTSWSTFRAPKIQPGSIKMEPPPKVLPPIRKHNTTFEKVSNWSNKFPVERTVEAENESNGNTTAELFTVNSNNTEPNHFEDMPNRNGQTNMGMISFTNKPHKLPKALHSMAHKIKFVPTSEEHNNACQLPPKPPSLAELRARGRKRLNFKRSQITPMHIDSPRSLSISSENSLAHKADLSSCRKRDADGVARSPSVDSGIIQSSGTDEVEMDYSIQEYSFS